MTAESMLSKRPVLRIIVALFFTCKRFYCLQLMCCCRVKQLTPGFGVWNFCVNFVECYLYNGFILLFALLACFQFPFLCLLWQFSWMEQISVICTFMIISLQSPAHFNDISVVVASGVLDRFPISKHCCTGLLVCFFM